MCEVAEWHKRDERSKKTVKISKAKKKIKKEQVEIIDPMKKI